MTGSTRAKYGAGPAASAPPGTGRFGLRAALGLVAVLVGAVPFLGLLLLVQRSWAPLAGLDGGVAADLNSAVRDHPAVIEALTVLTNAGGTGTSVVLLTLAFGWLAVRGQRRLAAFVAVGGFGLAVLVPVSKALVGRDRPDLDSPVVGLPGNASFPSGHAMCSLVTYGILLLLVLPRVPRSVGRLLVAPAAGVVLAVGLTRLALGVHFVTDVLAGYALGIAWLAAMTAAFRAWQHDLGLPAPALPTLPDPPGSNPAESGPGSASLRLPVLPAAAPTAARLAAGGLAVLAVLAGVGIVVSDRLGVRALGGLDTAVAGGVLDLRSDTATDIARAVSSLSSTRAVVTLALMQAVLVHAWTRRWRPVVFVALAVAGEVALYFVTAQIVGRTRPTVPDLHGDLPAAASFPSGHVAAAVAVYGAATVLVLTCSRSRRRWWALALPLTVSPLVAASRVYLAAHYLTDVLAGLLLGTLWLVVLTRALRLPIWAGLREGAP